MRVNIQSARGFIDTVRVNIQSARGFIDMMKVQENDCQQSLEYLESLQGNVPISSIRIPFHCNKLKKTTNILNKTAFQ